MPPAYLQLPDVRQCLGSARPTPEASYTEYCFPYEKPKECPDESWTTWTVKYSEFENGPDNETGHWPRLCSSYNWILKATNKYWHNRSTRCKLICIFRLSTLICVSNLGLYVVNTIYQLTASNKYTCSDDSRCSHTGTRGNMVNSNQGWGGFKTLITTILYASTFY